MSMRVIVVAALLLCIALQGYAAWQRRGRPWGFQAAQGAVGLIALLVMLWIWFCWTV
jgi:hypothetical protein